MEMYLNGVSTRKVTQITEKLCGVSFSRFSVSQLCIDLDAKVNAWNNRSLSNIKYPFLIFDGLFVKVIKELGVVPMSMLIAIGVNKEGCREILGVYLDDSERQSRW